MSAFHSQSPSVAMTVISANVEGLTASNASMLSDVCKEQHCHCLCLQEAHRGERKARPKIPVMTLVADVLTTNMEALFSSEGEEYFCHCSQQC